MFDIIYVMLMTVLGAGLFWLRGSATFEQVVGRGKTTADTMWALGLAVPTALYIPWYYAGGLLAALFLGGRAPWWKSIDMGRNQSYYDNTTYMQDIVMQTIRGVLWVLPAAILLWFISGWYTLMLMAAGLMAGPAYELGWQLNPQNYRRPHATEIGELVFGACVGGTTAMVSTLS